MAHVLNILKEHEKKLLMDRYSDLEFVDDINGLKCAKCDNVAISHFFSNCDHIFCSNCKNLQIKNQQTCPKCQTLITNIDIKKVIIELKIYGLKTHCPNQKNGCHEVATLVEISGHMKTCIKTKKESAGSSNNQTQIAQRLNLLEKRINGIQENQEKFEERINSSLQSFNINQTHLQSRINKIEADLSLRSNNNQNTHLNANISIKEIISEISNIKNEQITLENHLKMLEKPLKFLTETEYVWSINRDGAWFSMNKKDALIPVRRLTSPCFTIRGHSVDAQVTLMGSGYISLSFRNSTNDKQTLQMCNPLPKILYSVCNEDGSGEMYSMVQYIGFIHQIKPDAKDYKTPMVQLLQDVGPFSNGTPFRILIKVEFSHLVEKPFSTNGILQWNVKDFRSKCDFIYSPCFYTDSRGYRVNVSLSINNGLIVFINFLTGEFDHQLPTTAHFTTTVTVVDQSVNSKQGDIVKVIQSCTNDQIREGNQIISPNSGIDIEKYFINNILLLKVELKPNNVFQEEANKF